MVMVSSELSSLINKYDYSFTIPEICTALMTSRTNTAPGSDGIPTRILQLFELEDVLNVLNCHSIFSDIRNTVPDKLKHSIIISITKKDNSSSSPAWCWKKLCLRQTNKQTSSYSHA